MLSLCGDVENYAPIGLLTSDGKVYLLRFENHSKKRSLREVEGPCKLKGLPTTNSTTYTGCGPYSHQVCTAAALGLSERRRQNGCIVEGASAPPVLFFIPSRVSPMTIVSAVDIFPSALAILV